MDEQINQVVSGQEIANSDNKMEVVYFRPGLHLRVLANFIDFFVLVFVFLFGFLGTREIIRNTPTYKAKSEQLVQIKLDSGVYEYDDDNILRDIVSVVNNDQGQSAKSRCVRSRKAIDKFIAYAEEVATPANYNVIVDDYRNFRLSDSMKKGDIPMFIIDEDDNVIENPVLFEGVESISAGIYTTYFETAYAPYLDERVQGYLLTAIPNYKSIISYQTAMLLWVNIFMVYCVAGILVYLIPPLFFKRGRMTIGKWVYGIGVVDYRCLSPKVGIAIARFAIFYFGIYILSLFTFGLPLILNFTLMAFSKNKQSFPDYMLRLVEVDARRTKIYLSFLEVELEKTSPHKKAVNFRTRNFD